MDVVKIDPIKSISNLISEGQACLVDSGIAGEIWTNFGFVKFEGDVLKEKILCKKCLRPFTLRDSKGNSTIYKLRLCRLS